MPSLFSKLTDLDFLNRVKPITLQRYGAALQPFTSWAMEEGLDPISAEDWDDALLDYRGLHVATMTKSKFITLVASLEFYLPQVKGKLCWSHTFISGWSRRTKIRHTVPVTKRTATLLAVHMAVRGAPRMGLGIMLQVRTGLRPGELLKLMPEHILFPEDQGDWSQATPVVIVLGAKGGTKSQRAQVALLHRGEPEFWSLLKTCRDATPPGHYLIPYTMATYRMELRNLEKILKVSIGWTPHSPRAGFATDQKLAGVSFEQIQEAGRWASQSSLRIYLDVVGATNGLRAIRMGGLSSQLEAANRLWPLYFR